MVETDIKNLETYDPSEIPDEVLRDDWRIVIAWWSQILAGREFTYSREQVINVASLIYEELKKRGTKFKPEEYSEAGKSLFEIVSKGQLEETDAERQLATIMRSGEEMGDVIKLEDVLPIFKDIYTNKPYIYLVGGLCNHPDEGTTGDIDILIRKKKPLDNEMLPTIFRIYRMFPRDMWDRIQILWSNDDFGPFTNYVPLYDQLLERRTDNEITLMSEAGPETRIITARAADEEDQEIDYPEFEPDFNVQDEYNLEDAVRSTKPHILQMAQESRSRGAKPLRFFEMLKGIAGYRKMEKFTPEGVLAVTKEKDYPYEVDEKFDGMRIQLHKKGSKVKIFSIDGSNLTRKLQFMADELGKLKHDVVLDAELTGWKEGFRKGTHIGRSDVSGFMHAKSRLPHLNFYANTFDILFLDGNDLHNKPLSERRAALESIKGTEHIRIVEMKAAKNPTELLAAIKWASSFPGSEGAMIKSLKSQYPLSGMTSKWIKFKVEADIDAEVLEVHQVKNSKAKNYLCIIRTGKGDPIPVGRTYNTSIDAKVGDIIRVAFGNLNEYTDPKTERVWFNWVFPRVIELREDKDKPDNDATARNLVEETNGEKGVKPYPKRYARLLKDIEKAEKQNDFLEAYPDIELAELAQVMDFTSEELGEIIRDNPAKWGNSARLNGVFDADPFLTPGNEEKKWGFVVQNHFRGRSLHQDIRFERPSFLVGYTLNVQKEGNPKDDIDTMEEAKKFASNKTNVKNFKQGTPGAQQIVVEKKAPEPLPWLKYEGVMKPGQVGATKENEGVFDIVATGEVEFGTQKPHFREYWLHDTKKIYGYNGRIVFRLLKNIWKTELTGRGKFVWMAWFTKDQDPYILSKRAVDLGVMPPEGLSWLPRDIRKKVPEEYRYWKQKGKKAKELRDELSELWRKGKIKFDQTALTTEERDTYNKWKKLVNMTKKELEAFIESPEGKIAGLSKEEAQKMGGIKTGRESAKWILKMKNIPPENWTKEMWTWANRQISFISRMRGIKGPLVKPDGSKTRKLTSLLIWGHNPLKDAASDIPESGNFTLSNICWRGPIIVRYGCSRQEHHLFMKGKDDTEVFDIILDGDPIELGKVSAVIGDPKDKEVMSMQGKIPNGTPLNPDKKTPADIKIMEKGTFKADKENPNRIEIEMKGPTFKGKWLLTRTRPKTSLWIFKKAP